MNPRTGFRLGSRAWAFSCPRRYLRLLPREGTSEAALKVFGGLNGSEPDGEINGTVGGTVYPVLYVTIGAGERCTTGSVTLRIADEYPGYWDGTEAYTDTSISLSSASGWEVYNGSSWVGAQDGPSSTDNKEGATPLRYRYVVTGGWLTHKTPFGNNGPHSLSTTSQIEFEEWVVGDGWTHEYPCGPAATSVTTENLWISSCTASNGTLDYFKYDPDGDTALAHPHLQFTISDADPHKYCCIIRFRETIGEGTWNWDSGWSSMRKDLGINRTVDIDLTVPDDEGHCLNEDDHEWGTYTYDFLVLEYDGASPQWIQDNAHDWNFLKRYREGYYLWVPKDLPSPYGDKPGHDVWRKVPESGGTELRGYYCLESEWAAAEEAQVPRLDDDVCIVVVDPGLNEQASRTGPSVPEALGADYGTVDNDQNQKLDGLLLYTLQDSDPAGTWRGIFTAADNGGLRSPEWRSHTPLRMLTANQGVEDVTADNMAFYWGYYETSPYCTTDTDKHEKGDKVQARFGLRYWDASGELSLPVITDAADHYFATQKKGGFRAGQLGGGKENGTWADASNTLKANVSLFTFNGHAADAGLQPAISFWYDKKWQQLRGYDDKSAPPSGMHYHNFRDCWGALPPPLAKRMKGLWFALLLGCHTVVPGLHGLGDELVTTEGGNACGGFDCRVWAAPMTAFGKYFWNLTMGHDDGFIPKDLRNRGPQPINTAGPEALDLVRASANGTVYERAVPGQDNWHVITKEGCRFVIAANQQ